MEANKFTDVVGYEGLYKINKDGKVISVKRNAELYTYIQKSGYVSCRLYKKGKGQTFTIHSLMALVFLNFKSNRKTHIDHINDCKSDNRLENLRIISARENTSRTKRAGCSSRFVGVYYMKSKKKWDARTRINGKVNHIGYFKSEEEARTAYENFIKGL